MNSPRHRVGLPRFSDRVAADDRRPHDPEQTTDVIKSAPVEFLECAGPPIQPLVVRCWRALRAWHAQDVTRRALVRDLSSYRTSAEVHELSAVVARYDDDDVAEIKRILQVRTGLVVPLS